MYQPFFNNFATLLTLNQFDIIFTSLKFELKTIKHNPKFFLVVRHSYHINHRIKLFCQVLVAFQGMFHTSEPKPHTTRAKQLFPTAVFHAHNSHNNKYTPTMSSC